MSEISVFVFARIDYKLSNNFFLYRTTIIIQTEVFEHLLSINKLFFFKLLSVYMIAIFIFNLKFSFLLYSIYFNLYVFILLVIISSFLFNTYTV